MKEIHVYQNDDGTYRVVITDKTALQRQKLKSKKQTFI